LLPLFSRSTDPLENGTIRAGILNRFDKAFLMILERFGKSKK